MKKIIALVSALIMAASVFSFSASAATLELADIYTEYGRGESIYIQGTTDVESVLAVILDEYENVRYVKTLDRYMVYEGVSIPITEGWPLGDYTLRVGFGDLVVNEYHFAILEEPVDHTPEKDTSSGTGGKKVTATQISISPANLELKVGESAQVSVTAENASIRWETDDDNMITISGTNTATITAKKTGTATAWVYSGNNYATLQVKITPADKTGTSVGTNDKAEVKPEVKPEEKPEEKSEEEHEEAIFNDIESVAWAKESINALAKDGVINGMSAGVFAPDENVTRAQFVKMIVEAFDFEVKGEASFADVSKETDWFAEYVLIAANNGIVNGYGENFGPNDNISCQDAALIMKRVADMKGIKLDEPAAEENEAAEYAREAVALLKGNGIISEEMGFSAAEKATRAQSAYLIYGVYKLK
ncbi:MAG: S-layer homology domain-containing protein [Clostridia bacterium]